ncbi:MAG: lyase family protein [Bacteroidota bacterium]|nr:lyase family protein [Bacteroidota bacterium]
MRKEKDFIGELKIPKEALYGINAVRAKSNFPDNTPFSKAWYKAVGTVKTAYYLTVKDFKAAAESKYDLSGSEIKLPDAETLEHLIMSAQEVSEGKYFEHFIVPAIQGGAGTAINMNINEIIANASLKRKGEAPGTYSLIDPFDNANIYQSTNDVIPTALKTASLLLLNELEESINQLRTETEKTERKYRHILRTAYTQMQQAVPSSYGLLFGSYNEALSRDWWRVSKCFERIKTVNIGGGAAGTSVGIPRYVVMQTARKLQEITKLPLNSSDNLLDTTANLDAFTEVHAILKAHAVNLEKISADIRLLSSDLITNPEINIPAKQTGSSIMPGKVNPVIPEFVISCAQKVQSNDMLISALAAKGSLDLNAYLPLIGHALLESLNLLIAANDSLLKNLIIDMEIKPQAAKKNLYRNPAVCTALNPYIGYQKAGETAHKMQTDACDVFTALKSLNFMSSEKAKHILSPEEMLKAGFSLDDVLD